ncbi:SusD/RagB family nutrient-binding outer membrane lipoprotein [Flavobacterium sp. CYK-55]|uniref:SusD/RagB family nutrient-binding outer membrane lipoprotein n=1 Tax=Flavobacterium sp. CYK-55 TaxID=2835529 RepID=UPI001BCEFE9D|nr:SusD/RagB family nutrient-binding outer membrane lipoprotein [Flavobacterium sp. CYK-55]MBS7785691.1 SusD/RagB family nutrient-binding outer membrane lipoprotein [Flavobacterium sp. CYK-55]
MNKKYIKLLLVAFTVSIWGCETVDLDQTENPSTINANLLEPKYTFNYIQLQLPDFVDQTNSFTQRITRQMAMTGGNTYDNAFAPVNFNQQWSTGYNILNAIKLMEPKANQQNLNFVMGASKIIRCYVLMTFVDMYGDIPYSQALQGNANITPAFDKDSEVYASIITELDDAIAKFDLPDNPKIKIQDLYYGGLSAKWIKLANTLKLKMYNNCNLLSTLGTKNVANEINQIINSNNIINDASDDFVFKYGNSRFNPNSRHPLYNDQYERGGGSYIGNYFMWAMTTEKGATSDFTNSIQNPGDPRVNFYFYRQDADPQNEDTFTIPGRSRPENYNNISYNSFYDNTIRTCYTVSNWVAGAMPQFGYLGRDHGNNAGLPPDSDKRTVAGTYPIGGMYGGESANSVQTDGNKGKLGAGIMPIMLSSFVHFMKAELILKNIISGSAKTEFETAITHSIDKTTGLFADYPVLDQNDQDDLLAKKTKYINYVSGFFDNQTTDGKLEMVIKEFYIAAWGNGIEPYNNYRRTGYPSNFQPTLEPLPGAFYNCAYYSGNCVNNNPNAPSNVRTRKVFWAVPNNKELY